VPNETVAKVGGGQIHSISAISKFGRDASHGSHGAVTPIRVNTFKVKAKNLSLEWSEGRGQSSRTPSLKDASEYQCRAPWRFDKDFVAVGEASLPFHI